MDFWVGSWQYLLDSISLRQCHYRSPSRNISVWSF